MAGCDEYDFKGRLKNGRSAGNGAYAWKGNTSKVMDGGQ
jgi:hypothetical protein